MDAPKKVFHWNNTQTIPSVSRPQSRSQLASHTLALIGAVVAITLVGPGSGSGAGLFTLLGVRNLVV